jgi:hypothetical protein
MRKDTRKNIVSLEVQHDLVSLIGFFVSLFVFRNKSARHGRKPTTASAKRPSVGDAAPHYTCFLAPADCCGVVFCFCAVRPSAALSKAFLDQLSATGISFRDDARLLLKTEVSKTTRSNVRERRLHAGSIFL